MKRPQAAILILAIFAIMPALPCFSQPRLLEAEHGLRAGDSLTVQVVEQFVLHLSAGNRLHLGIQSFGCVTINKKQDNSNAMWDVLVGIMNRTKTSRVKEKRGRQGNTPFNYRTWYGKMAVIGGK